MNRRPFEQLLEDFAAETGRPLWKVRQPMGRDDPRILAQVKRVEAAWRRGQETLCYCQHPDFVLGVVFTPVAYQLFEVCANLACREILSGPLDHGATPLSALAPDRLLVLGDTSRAGRQCAVPGCVAADLELHHWWPRAIYGDAADDGPTDLFCTFHHRDWHRRMRAGA